MPSPFPGMDPFNDYSLDYRIPIEPPLGEADAAWAQQVLAARASDVSHQVPIAREEG